MWYDPSPNKWTVLAGVDTQNNKFCDVREGDVLELTEDASGNDIVMLHRLWGTECVYDATNPSVPKVKGIHRASGSRRDTFELTIEPHPSPTKDKHRGDITEGTGTGGNGTWTAQEGG